MKEWRHVLEQHVEYWASKHRNRDWVPRHVYHFTTVENAARILEEGCVYSRSQMRTLGLAYQDQASSDVIASTMPEHQAYARLYFRPRTPTQYHMEGIRPLGGITWLKAHCPVPVFLCFDFVETLLMDGTRFSNGNMASASAQHSDTEEFFRALPFEQIYKTGAMQDRQLETFHRNAEILVPHQLPLNHKLRHVVCRSQAERRTLLSFLTPKARKHWARRIRVSMEYLFERSWWHVVSVHADRRVVQINLHAGPQPVEATYERLDSRGEVVGFYEKELSGRRGEIVTMRIRTPRTVSSVIRVMLCGHLAFQGHVMGSDAPF